MDWLFYFVGICYLTIRLLLVLSEICCVRGWPVLVEGLRLHWRVWAVSQSATGPQRRFEPLMGGPDLKTGLGRAGRSQWATPPHQGCWNISISQSRPATIYIAWQSYWFLGLLFPYEDQSPPNKNNNTLNCLDSHSHQQWKCLTKCSPLFSIYLLSLASN